ncbi:HlyD family secretion protein [Telmatospirillum siberiense]|uniref:Efflux transporter periplasmic adaptor subunit n=1 Tax=Telmatospirillum siberiense TaxID=382514 RepID=A0A2N3PP61_9PROT|nr:HlyD family secretion protein [Telmatospirillum siberiense]PKU22177.1 efflux transporter periplasmic adaptor subunit [Telmatospirillum siberiense]
MIKRFLRVVVTLALAAVAAVLSVALWHHFMVDPWTRDGRVRAEVVRIAPEVAGTVSEVRVVDNQFVHKGDVLFVIDPERFKLALTQVQAAVDSRAQDRRVALAKAQRRAALSDLVASTEEKEQYNGSAGVATAAVSEAQAQLDLAKLNLTRTTVRSPVNGYVTNLNLRVGDYASVGQAAIAVVDSDSFWVAGYFEETKLGALHVGDGAVIELMSDSRPLAGHVESLSHGIADQNGDASTNGLASVNPVFTWVRLAQRMPVRIHIDSVPRGLSLTAGMTCTVIVGTRSRFVDDLRFAYRSLTAGLI